MQYVYRDEHVHDVQPASAFANMANNWQAEYDAELDVWHVLTPSGLARTYTRLTRCTSTVSRHHSDDIVTAFTGAAGGPVALCGYHAMRLRIAN